MIASPCFAGETFVVAGHKAKGLVGGKAGQRQKANNNLVWICPLYGLVRPPQSGTGQGRAELDIYLILVLTLNITICL